MSWLNDNHSEYDRFTKTKVAWAIEKSTDFCDSRKVSTTFLEGISRSQNRGILRFFFTLAVAARHAGCRFAHQRDRRFYSRPDLPGAPRSAWEIRRADGRHSGGAAHRHFRAVLEGIRGDRKHGAAQLSGDPLPQLRLFPRRVPERRSNAGGHDTACRSLPQRSRGRMR